MSRILRISVAALASVVVCAAMGVGVWWLFSALPTPTDLPDAPTPSPPASDIPRLAAIPWKRDPAHLEPFHLSPAWFPWTKSPKPLRTAPAWWAPPPNVPRPHTDPGEIDALAAALKSPDSDAQTRALARIEEIIRTDPLAAARPFAGLNQPLSAALIAAKRWPDLDHFAAELLIPCAYNTDLLDGLFAARAAAASAQHQFDTQLLRYRQWFAICSLRAAANVLAQTEQALRTTSANSKQATRDFRAAMEAAAPATQPAFSMKLPSDNPEAERFAAAAAAIHTEDYASLLMRANLYLLAARPDNAEPLFHRAYMLAPDSQIAAASENFARLLKAQTGSLLPANAWVKEHSE